MKKLFHLFAVLAMFAFASCDENGADNINPNDKTEQPGEQTDVPENLFFGLDKESVGISPDGGSVDVIVYSNYKWTISGTNDWCTPSVTSGVANEDGQKVTFSAALTYDTREAIFWFRCADEKIKFTVSQKQKDVIIASDDNTFNVPAEGGLVTIAYQTTVGCEIIIPDDAKDWILFAETRALVGESATLNVLENTTYSARSAVIKVVTVDNENLAVEYTINQAQNDAIIADENNTFHLPYTGGSVKIDYQTNVECKVIIPEEAQSWISIAPAETRALVGESATLNVAENTTYSARSAVIKVVTVDNENLAVEYTINQAQNDAIIADENNTFHLPYTGGSVKIDYQTNVECKVIIPEEAQSWISIAPAETRALVGESATLNVAENTTYSARSAVIKVVAVNNESLVVEYTINQVQNDAIIADENNAFNLNGLAQSISITYQTNVECEVVIPEEAKEWITLAPTTRALVNESATLNITENNTGAKRSAVVKVVAVANSELVAEYTITQNQRYFIEYTSSNGGVVTPYDSTGFGATILRNKYIDGKGYIDFDAPVTSIGSSAFFYCSSLASIIIPESVTSIGEYAFCGCSSLASVTIGNGVTSIGNYAFCNCSNLKSVTIPNSVTSIGGSAFKSCSSLTNITIPEGVTSIGSSAFSGCSSLTNITIPEGVTSIGSSAFSGCSSLTNITIPEGVTSIGSSAFSGCSSLASVTIPDSVTSIGSSAFYNCSSLENVTIGNSVTSIEQSTFSGCSSLASVTIPNSVTSIRSSAFSGCSSLTSVTIPDSVTSIGGSAFSGCSSLACINIGNGVTSIGSYAFNGCSSLTSVTIPDSVTSIGGSAFNGCSSLASINIPNSVTSIGEYAFQYCGKLTSITIPYSVTSIGEGAFYGFKGELIINSRIVMKNYTSSSYPKEDGWLYGSKLSKLTIGDNVKQIGEYTFYHCSSLTSVTIGNGVTEIRSSAFEGCSSLTSVTIGNGITSIGDDAFSDCTSLTSITIPESVTSIGGSAFYYCKSLAEVYCKPTTPPASGSRMFDTNASGRKIYVPTESVNAYKSAKYWSNYADALIPYDFEQGEIMIPENWKIHYTSTNGNIVTPYATDVFGAYLVSNTYENGKGIITFDGDVTSIGSYAFRGCSSLASVTIPDSVTSIGNCAFCGCASLTSITIPESVTSIGYYAFDGCSSLTNITIPEGVTSIGDGAFSDCSSLTNINIPNSVTSIGGSAFEYCSSLTNITIPEGVTSIGGSAFEYCSSLTNITIPEGVTSIGDGAFCGCSSLTNITIPEGVTSIGNSAFSGCSSLTNITIPEGVTSIGSYAFNGCSSLASVTIPDSVTSIGNYAFCGCASLTSITIPESVTSIGYYAFDGCKGELIINSKSLAAKNYTSSYPAGWLAGSQFTSLVIGNGVTSIGDYAFKGCSSLESVTIGDGVTSIGGSAFSGCKGELIINSKSLAGKDYNSSNHPNYNSSGWLYGSNFTSLVIGNSVTSIGSYAFRGCSSLASVTIGNGVTSIGGRAFQYCSSLASIIIPESVTSIGEDAFYACSSLESITIGDGVTSIGDYAFKGCSSLASIIIPESVTSIGEYAFCGCSSLASVTIGNGVTSIGGRAFQYCSSLASVTIPDSVTSIGECAFYDCDSLTSVYCKATTPPAGNEYMFAYNASGRKIYVPTESVDAYKSAQYWMDYSSYIYGYDF